MVIELTFLCVRWSLVALTSVHHDIDYSQNNANCIYIHLLLNIQSVKIQGDCYVTIVHVYKCIYRAACMWTR